MQTQTHMMGSELHVDRNNHLHVRNNEHTHAHTQTHTHTHAHAHPDTDTINTDTDTHTDTHRHTLFRTLQGGPVVVGPPLVEASLAPVRVPGHRSHPERWTPRRPVAVGTELQAARSGEPPDHAGRPVETPGQQAQGLLAPHAAATRRALCAMRHRRRPQGAAP